jgi:hypothetical protein
LSSLKPPGRILPGCAGDWRLLSLAIIVFWRLLSSTTIFDNDLHRTLRIKQIMLGVAKFWQGEALSNMPTFRIRMAAR